MAQKTPFDGAAASRQKHDSEKAMSDRWQYVVGGIISLVLAMGYLTLTDDLPPDQTRAEGASVASGQSKVPLSLDTGSAVAPNAFLTVSASASSSSTPPALRSAPEVVRPNLEPDSNQKNGLAARLAAPAAAPDPVGLDGQSNGQANSE